MDAVSPRFEILDYVICTAVLCISLGIGIYHSLHDRSSQSEENYLMANRSMAVVPVVCSLFVTQYSAISFIG